MFTSERKFAIADGVEWTISGDESILLDSRRGIFFGVDGVGAIVWNALAAGKTLNGILYELESEFDASREVLLADVDGFLNDLIGRELLIERL